MRTVPHHHRRPAGFTLVELLVVIGIIALLISILLPALNKARASANSVKCLANLRSIGQAMQLYAAQYKGAIPGAPLNTARMFWTGDPSGTNHASFTMTTLPAGIPLEPYDYITPMSEALGFKSRIPDSQSIVQRFAEQVEKKMFLCPSSQGVTMISYPAGGPTLPLLGYNTAMAFLVTPGSPTPGDTYWTRISTGDGWPVLPTGYFPNIAKIGNSAAKIYAADGTRYNYQGGSGTIIEYNTYPFPNTYATKGGTQTKYSDWGAWSTGDYTGGLITSSYDKVSWQSTPGKVDTRLLSYRHGALSGHKDGSFKMNAVFFDGHAETIDDVESTNPMYWLPTGTTFTSKNNPLSKIGADEIARWNINSTTYSVP